MIELPEAATLARQSNEILRGKVIRTVVTAHTPHKFAWYWGDPQAYSSLLSGKSIGVAAAYGGQVEIAAGHARMLFSDGVNLRHLAPRERPPERHQLLLEFEDDSHLVATVQMYGGLSVFPEEKNDNKYYLIAKQKPSPLTDAFDEDWFDALFSADTAKLSLKALLATEQRIPGLGNGVLQDILFSARMHPKKKAGALSSADRRLLLGAVRTTLAAMAAGNGRDTETDLLGRPGGYRTTLSRTTAGRPCPACGGPITREAYMGGNVYYCAACQEM